MLLAMLALLLALLLQVTLSKHVKHKPKSKTTTTLLIYPPLQPQTGFFQLGRCWNKASNESQPAERERNSGVKDVSQGSRVSG